jgi:hypothetical protein
MAEKLGATFFAFRKREKGGVLVGSSIAYAIAFVLLYAALIGVAWFLIGGGEFMTWYNETMAAQVRGEVYSEPPPNPSGILLMIPLGLVWVFVMFVLLAAYESACVRWMLRGEESGPLRLHFGADMWRVYGTYWVWFLYILISWVVFVIAVAVSGIAGVQAGEASPLVVLGVALVFCLAWLYVTVRLSPASATSIGLGEFAPLKAWTVSRGRFWALFGAYLLLFIMYFVIVCVVTGITLSSYYSQVFGGLDWTLAQTNPDAFMREYEQASLAATQQMFSNPASIAIYIGSQVLAFAIAMVFYLLWFGIEARAVQAALMEGKIEKTVAV